ncbi:hypothetical protein BpHYR1_032308 [Brachionus plicatilis]|uniref:Uncharacterized protein n=1 Tax=Brachionus plicatilis TaxID=10195 RepID=A0A3M7Q5V1_BRAPC|nr:hypothetical protein BpHYR1_032308 [Brachionus plicatilis]
MAKELLVKLRVSSFFFLWFVLWAAFIKLRECISVCVMHNRNSLIKHRALSIKEVEKKTSFRSGESYNLKKYKFKTIL